jgi:hypothetical protein
MPENECYCDCLNCELGDHELCIFECKDHADDEMPDFDLFIEDDDMT